MKTHLTLILLLALVAGAMAAEEIPQFPDEYSGTLTIDGTPAPAGTTITALIGGEVRGTLTTTQEGVFGGSDQYDQKLAVTGYASDIGRTITFTVNGKTVPMTATFDPDKQHTLAIAATGGGTNPPGPSGPGGGGDGGGSSSPRVPVTTAPALQAAATTATLPPAPTGTTAAGTPAPVDTAAPTGEAPGDLNTIIWTAAALSLVVIACIAGFYIGKNRKE
ncbi:hypothetical protein [Methanofollis sp. UBA420]|jgi:hypothetical protein|uniref:hypothetical protein n=1 Tax=Methanofollis sp. UBA420 TaxID=1915514 RepID=UPI00316ACAF2